QAELIAAVAFADTGDMDLAREQLNDTLKRWPRGDDASELTLEATLELARAHQAVGDSEAAKTLLIDLATRHGNSDEIWEMIDRVADEPLSDKGKRRAIALNQEGKELFAKQDFTAAITLFNEALRIYPNSIALKLNLLLALVKSMSGGAIDPDHLLRAEQLVSTMRNLSDEHALFDR